MSRGQLWRVVVILAARKSPDGRIYLSDISIRNKLSKCLNICRNVLKHCQQCHSGQTVLLIGTSELKRLDSRHLEDDSAVVCAIDGYANKGCPFWVSLGERGRAQFLSAAIGQRPKNYLSCCSCCSCCCSPFGSFPH